MSNIENLVPLTTEKAREIGAKGGKASGLAKQRKKTLKELANQLGSMKITDPEVIENLQKLGLNVEDFTNDMAIVAAQYKKAKEGDTAAAAYVRDTKGESPKNNELVLGENIESITIKFGKGKTIEGEVE